MSFYKAKQETGFLPWCCDDEDQLGSVVSEFASKHDDFVTHWAKRWFENFQFVYGNHDLQWSNRFGMPVDYDFLRRSQQSFNSKSQTNTSRTVFESLKSLIFSSLPDWDITTAEEAFNQGRRFQKLGRKLLECYAQRLELQHELDMLAGIYTAYGLAATKVDWNPAAGGVAEFPEMETKEIDISTTEYVMGPHGVGQIMASFNDSQGQPARRSELVPARNPDGSVKMVRRWTGDARITSLTPFEYRRELNPGGAKKSKWFEHIRIMDYDDFLAEYGQLEGRTKYFGHVKPGIASEGIYKFAMRHYLRMNFVTPVTVSDYKRQTAAMMKHELIKQKVFVIEHYDKPNPTKWPDGRVTVVVNGYATHVTQPQYNTKKVGGWHPFSEAQWLNLAPSPMPSAPMNDVTAKNKELNTLDSLIDTSIKRNMGSMVLVKNSAGIDLDRLMGEPGQILSVNSTDAVRFVRDDQPIPPIAPQLRDIKKNDIYEISGAQDATRGDRSKGASSGYMLRQLQEREERRLTPARQKFEKLVSETGEKVIACIRANAHNLGEDVYGFLKRSAAGEFSPSDITAFINTPLDFGVDVIVRPDSMLAKTKASQQATYMDLINNPTIGDRLKDPGVMDEFLKFFGADLLRNTSSVHMDRADKENELFADIGQLGPSGTGMTLPIVMPFDDDDIHIRKHEEDMVSKADELQTNPFELQARVFHLEMHKIQRREKMGEVPPGSTANFQATHDAMQAQQTKPAPQVYQEQQALNQARQAQDQQRQQQQAPKGPPQQETGQRPVDPNAPSQNTPQGQQDRLTRGQ
jgi:hypothetical protein